MPLNAYRVWQTWQQMHYPGRGLPVEDAARLDLVRLDGTAGPILERHFRRRARGAELDDEAIETLDRCRDELRVMAAALSSDASRYFERLLLLIELVLAREGRAQVRAADAV
jgi:hypothetical protein